MTRKELYQNNKMAQQYKDDWHDRFNNICLSAGFKIRAITGIAYGQKGFKIRPISFDGKWAQRSEYE